MSPTHTVKLIKHDGWGAPFGWVNGGNKEDTAVHVRKWIAAVPWLNVRVVRHEMDHLRYANFRSSGDHHDSDAYAEKYGAKKHMCGRGTKWTNVFSNKHLVTSKREAKELLKRGKATVSYEEGSQLDDAN